ncbi:hypothetical protein MLC52_03940 [Sulfurimonas sp. NW15]|uniref:hypothetical protein n=1 Tax=Sulfurimonas sp. NW15 TaxID=2922729 RepID=UPI003DAA4A0A
MHDIGIYSMGMLMNIIIRNINPNEEKSKLKIEKKLKKIKSDCFWRKGEWKGLYIKWNQIEHH